VTDADPYAQGEVQLWVSKTWPSTQQSCPGNLPAPAASPHNH
jgi:hypothetical protein